jgi:hypothetical protein
MVTPCTTTHQPAPLDRVSLAGSVLDDPVLSDGARAVWLGMVNAGVRIRDPLVDRALPFAPGETREAVVAYLVELARRGYLAELDAVVRDLARTPQLLRRLEADRAAAKAFRRIGERDGFSCRHCGTAALLTVDHVVAVANGGTDDDDNLQLLCRSCNSRKGTR